jgi:hypothetical protein
LVAGHGCAGSGAEGKRWRGVVFGVEEKNHGGGTDEKNCVVEPGRGG